MFEMMPYSGLQPLRRLRREMDDVFGRILTPTDWPGLLGDSDFMPMADATETEDALELSIEVPGMKRDDIEVSLSGSLLSIKGEKKEEKEERKGDIHLTERRFGAFQRSFRLPVEVKGEELTAKYENGVLKVTVPKAEVHPTKLIEVEGG
jgi:HSP20 family protein